MLDQKRKLTLDESLHFEMSVLRTGHVDPTRVAVLTSWKALEIAQNKADIDVRKRNAEREAEVRRALRTVAREEKQKRRLNHEELYMNVCRAALASMPVNVFEAQMRTMKERRATARVNAIERKRNLHPESASRSPISPLVSIACIDK